MGSTRLRAYDIIMYLNQTKGFSAELYKNWKANKYDVVIFQKYFNQEAYKLANLLKNKGIKVILDINVNYYEASNTLFVNETQRKDVFSFTEVADGLITTTQYLKDIIAQHFPTKNVIVILENISESFFKNKKRHGEKKVINLLYAGYSVKASEILLVKDILEGLGKKYKLRMLFVCDKDPQITLENVSSEFIKYQQNKIHLQLMEGDIKLSPRDLEDPYNRGHSFTKIGYPMAAGIPVVASPIDSYKNSPAILCTTKEEWESELEKLIVDHEYREELSIKGVAYCKRYLMKTLGKKYETFLSQIVNDVE